MNRTIDVLGGAFLVGTRERCDRGDGVSVISVPVPPPSLELDPR